MLTISAQNVHQVLKSALDVIEDVAHLEETRNGPALVFEGPVTTVYECPEQRVMFWADRDANPFFHFMEGLWMIAGRNDVAWISRFSKNIEQYSDNGRTFHGAYGHRWRHHFGIDQLAIAAEALIKNPSDRRVVVQMWDPRTDLGKEGKDFPCNTSFKLRIEDGYLNMFVENRSNDMVWGAYGANAVHFSMMQEVMAAWIGVEIGSYWQISTNLHAYTKTLEQVMPIRDLPAYDYYLGYNGVSVESHAMVNIPIDLWFQELDMFMEAGDAVLGYKDPFFKRVAIPILQAHRMYKEKRHADAIKHIQNNCEASDWSLAITQWLERRIK